MLIKLDTRVMFEMAACAKTACQYIKDSSEVSYQIVPHNDWNCQERDYINDGIQTIKKQQLKISEKVMQFSDAISQVATTFLEVEATLPNLFNEVDTCVGEMFSVANTNLSSNAQTAAQPFVEQLKSMPFKGDSFQNYAVSIIDSPSSICNFSDIDFGKSEE